MTLTHALARSRRVVLRFGLSAVAAATCLLVGVAVHAQAVRGPRITSGPGAGLPTGHANVFAGNDDGSTGPINLGFTANFFGTTYTQTFVNNNGNVTFGRGFGGFTPFGLQTSTQPMIAAFFGDVDTRRQRLSNPTAPGLGFTSFAAYDASTDFGQLFGGRNVFSVTWSDVGFFSQGTNATNTFQLNLVDRRDVRAGDFDIEFNYDQVQWETGTASGGNSNGLGGASAVVGFTAGTGQQGTVVQLDGSLVNGAFIDGGPNALIANRFGTLVAGRYVFPVRNNALGVPGASPTTPQLPTTILPGNPALGIPPTFVFTNVTSGRWFDPPDTYGYLYRGTGGTAFTRVGLPGGFSPFTLCWGANFGTCRSSIVGDGSSTFDFGGAIDAFQVLGIDPLTDSSDPQAFPTQLFFQNGGTGSFTMTPILAPAASSTVPEPGTWALLGTGLMLLGAGTRLRRPR